MERVNPDFIQDDSDDWAIFKIDRGYGKCFVTTLSQITRGTFQECNYEVKYSDPSVLKFTLEKAKDLIKKNIWFGEKYGVVNSRGLQKLYDHKIKQEDR